MTPAEQVSLWVAGDSVHNDTDGQDECCPDFSCCLPDLLVHKEMRLQFQNEPDQKYKLLGMFLKKLLASQGKSDTTHVVGPND